MANPEQDKGNLLLKSQVLSNFLPELLNESVQKAQFEHLLPHPAPFHGRLLHLRFDGFTFDAGKYDRLIFAKGAMPQDHVTLGFTIAKNEGGLLNGSEIASMTPFVYAAGNELETKLPSHTQWFAMQVPLKRLLDAGVTVPVGQAGAVQIESQHLTEIAAVLNSSLQLFTELATGNRPIHNRTRQLRSQLEGVFASFAGVLHPQARSQPRTQPLNRLKTVEVACDYMEANYSEVVRVCELSKLTGGSYKSLERAFNTVIGMSPQRYLANLRLSRARQMLQTGCEKQHSVSEVANACGCFHLGRFSQSYRRLYGESPSQTLKGKRR